MRRSRLSGCLSALFFGTVTLAGAFPGWMGVYDYYQRHDGGNPGRFLILMNQSYVGLEANVGYRVNGGTNWAEYPMSYVTDVDGNSLWEYIPSQPFPFGANVEFYFHGYDADPTNNIYDSRDTLNYFSGPLAWNNQTELPLFSVYPNNSLPAADYAAGGHHLYAALAFAGISTNLTLSRKVPGKDWVSFPVTGPGGVISEFDLAADDTHVVLAYRADTNLFVITSPDHGTTWNPALQIATIDANPSGPEIAANGQGGFAVVYGVSTNCCGSHSLHVITSTNAGQQWSSPVSAFNFGAVGAYATSLELAGNQQGWFLATLEVNQGGAQVMRGGFSSDGNAWTMTYLGGDGQAWPGFDLAVGTNRAIIAADPYYNTSTWVWASAAGGGWTTQSIGRALENGAQILLGSDLQHAFFLYRFEDNDASPSSSLYLPTYRVSEDNGTTWSYPRPVPLTKPASNNYVTLQAVISAQGPVQRLVWHHNDYVSMFQRMHSVWYQETDGFQEALGSDVLGEGQFLIAATNLTPGMSHQLEYASGVTSTTWSNLATLSHGATSIVVNAPAGQPGGIYRIKSSY